MFDGLVPPFIVAVTTVGLIAVRQLYAVRAPGLAAGALVVVAILTGSSSGRWGGR